MKKRFMSVVLALAMVISMLPSAFATGTSSGEDSSFSETDIRYVSLGDSMTNGYGLEDYEYENDGEYINVNGYMQEADEAYPAIFKNYLETIYGEDNVDLIQLATSGLRAEDILYLLTYGTENESLLDTYGEVYISQKLHGYYNEVLGMGYNQTELWEQGHADFTDAVDNANVISVGVGSNNFASYMTIALTACASNMAGDFGGMFGAGAVECEHDWASLIAGEDAELQAQIQSVYDDFLAMLKDEAAAQGISLAIVLNPETGYTLEDMLLTMADAAAYTTAGFFIGYTGIINYIREKNSDADVLLVGITNWLKNMTIAVPVGDDALVLPIGEYLDYLYSAANLYVAGLPAVYEYIDEFNGVEPQAMYYAPVDDVELLNEEMARKYADWAEENPDAEMIDTDAIFTNMTRRRMVRDVFDKILVNMGMSPVDISVIELYEQMYAEYTAIKEGTGMTVAEYIYAQMDAIDDVVVAMGGAAPYAAAPRTLTYLIGAYFEGQDHSVLDISAGVMEPGTDVPNDHQVGWEVGAGCMAYLGIEQALIKSSSLEAFDASTFLTLTGSGENGLMGTVMKVFDAELGENWLSNSALTPKAIGDALYQPVNVPEYTATLRGLSQIFASYVIGEGILCHPSPMGHEDTANAMIAVYKSGYTAGDYIEDKVTAAVNAATALIAEYYDEAYAYGYQYAVDAGYIDAAVAAIDKAIADIDAIALDAYEMTEAFKAEAQAAIDEMKKTLEEAKETLLTEADALYQVSLDTLKTLLDEAGDAAVALNDAFVQAGIDVTELTIIPYINDELIPAVQKAATEMATKAAEYLQEKLGEAYDALIEVVIEALPGVDAALYDWLYNNPEKVIAFFAEYGDEIAALTEKYGENALGILAYVAFTFGDELVDYVINNPEEVLNTLVGWYGEYGYRVWPMIDKYLEALGVYDEIEKIEDETSVQLEAALEQIKAALEEVKKTIDENIAPAVRAEVEALIAQAEAQIAYLEAVVNGQIEATAQEIINALTQMNETVKGIIAAAKAEGEAFLEAAAAELKRVICESINAFQTQVEKQLGIVDEAIRAKITEVLDQVIATLENIKHAIDEDIAPAVRAEIEALIAQIEAQVAYLEAVVNGQIEATVQDIIVALTQMNETVEKLFAAIKAEGEALAQAAVAELQRVVGEAIDAIVIEVYYATNLTLIKCDYTELDYLALGGATAAEGTYAEIIAEYLEAASAANVADAALTYADLLTYITDNAAAIAGADVITYQMDANEIVEALVNVMLATVIGGEYTSPDWSNYIDVEGITTTVNEAQATAQALQAKVAQYLRAEDLETLESIENQVMAHIDAAIDEETMKQIRPYAECLVYGLVSYAVENAKAIEAIKTINPDAEIVMLGLYNTLNGVTVVMNGETIDLGELFDYVVEAVDVYNLIYAVVSGNVTIVNISGAAVDGAELNVDEIMGLYTKLQGGGLTLDEMLAAGEAIEVALANVEAAVYGTANAEGQAYIAEQIKAAVTVMDHDYIAVVTEPTCTEAGYTTYTCSVCGDDYTVDGDAATDHAWSAWTKVDANDHKRVCGNDATHVEVVPHVFGGDNICDDCAYDKTPAGPVGPGGGGAGGGGGAAVTKPVNPFTDVDKDDYWYDAVLWAVEKGITNGITPTTFAPTEGCTRGQMVTFLWRSVGSPAPKTTVCPFTDVDKDAYFYDAVLWAVENGITLGVTETTFEPYTTCSRAHMVTFISRFAKGTPVGDSNNFVDVPENVYYTDPVQWAVETGVTNGTTATTFSPNNPCTRGQMVTFLYRHFEK